MGDEVLVLTLDIGGDSTDAQAALDDLVASLQAAQGSADNLTGPLDAVGASGETAGQGGLAAQAGAEEAYASLDNLTTISGDAQTALEDVGSAGDTADSGLSGAASSADDAGSGFTGASSGAGDLAGALGSLDSDLDPVVSGISGMASSLSDMVDSGDLDLTAAGLLGIGAAGVVAVGGIGLVGANLEQQAMQFQAMTGANAEQTAFWSAMLGDFGLNLGSVQMAMGMLSTKVGAYQVMAQQGKTDTSGFATTMADLGVQMLDSNGNALPMIDIFQQIMDKLIAVKDPAQQMNDVSLIFSRTLKTQLMPVIQGYSDILPTVNQQTADTAWQFENAKGKAVPYDTAMQKLKEKVDALGVETLPYLTDALGVVGLGIEGVVGETQSFYGGLDDLWNEAKQVGEDALPTLDAALGIAETALSDASTAAGWVRDTMGDITDDAGPLLSGALGDVDAAFGWFQGVIEGADGVLGDIETTIGDVTGALGGLEGKLNNIPGVSGAKHLLGFASGGVTPYSGLFNVGESGPETVALPAGSRVYSNSESKAMGNQTNSPNYGVINYNFPNVRNAADIIRAQANLFRGL
ncbi:MAG: hypothetical protein ABSC13_06300 [Dehalococcoidia bacterium]|jgi:hypothetical protein